MRCQRCNTKRIVMVSSKSSDLNSFTLVRESGPGGGVDGYVPRDLGVGGGDYIEFSYCLECGQIQGKWPLSEAEIEQ